MDGDLKISMIFRFLFHLPYVSLRWAQIWAQIWA